MAITTLPDGRVICYYRVPETRPERLAKGKKSRLIKEYFGRGPDAEATAKKRNDELGLKKHRPPKRREGPTVSELAKSYYENKNFNENSKKHLKIRLEAKLMPFFGHMYAIRLTDQDLDNYVQKRRRDPIYSRSDPPKIIRYGVKDATIARELTDLQAILNWSVKRRPALIRFNPVRDYKKPAQDNEIILPPTMKETTLIIKHAPPHLVRAIKLSYYLGLRPGAVELLKLTWSDINWGSKTILVRSAHKGGPQRRHVPLHDELFKELKAWHKKDQQNGIGHIIHYHGKPIKKIQSAWEGTLARAGITRRIRLYDLRHNFITQALEGGADVKALSEIVGSAPETIMRHYQHVTRKLHRKTVAKIPSLKNEQAVDNGKL